jgi:hypothetical protein
MGESMAGPAYGTASGTEISARSKELVLPIDAVPESTHSIHAPGRKTGLSERAAPRPEASHSASPTDAGRGTTAEETLRPASQPTTLATTQPARTTATTPVVERGIALPGDRGPRIQPSKNQRPSFWRRIALGGRRASQVEVVTPDSAFTNPSANPSADTSAIEQRIIEPMLQALVSVEAKLERSHIDLTKRSDQVEQRLTQLWDIEEQLGTLGELHESLLQVSQQQRRLESAVVTQTRTLRWLVGAIFFSLAATVLVVAAMIR